MTSDKVTPDHIRRRAIVYVRQSTVIQVLHNLESQRRQYNLVEYARELGFSDVVTIDEDLGRSGSGLVERPGFQRLVAEVCAGQVWAVLFIEASRLARNGRDWHHLIELCGVVGAVVIDPSRGLYHVGAVRTQSEDAQRKQFHADREYAQGGPRGPRLAHRPLAMPAVRPDALHLLYRPRRSGSLRLQGSEHRPWWTKVHLFRRRQARAADCR